MRDAPAAVPGFPPAAVPGFLPTAALGLLPAALALLLAAALVVPAVAAPAGPSSSASPDGTAAERAGATPTPTGGNASAAAGEPRIVAVYPNPAVPGDRAEFVVLALPPGTDGSTLALDDGEDVARLPDRVPDGRVAVVFAPAARNLTDAPVVLPDRPLRLANAGERVALRRVGADGRPGPALDAVAYEDAPEGERYRRTDDGWAWRALGATAFPVRTVDGVRARPFVLPDAPGAALAPLRAARQRLWLAGYTLTSRRVVDVLCAAAADGVDVRVLVERFPVGGMAAAEARLLDRLVACGVVPRVIGGRHARYGVHHAKYAVADDRAVVLTENWKPAGVGGRSSRGWGVVLDAPAVADALGATFEADAGWRDARPWPAVRDATDADRVEPPATGRYARAFTPTEVGDVRVELLVAPDNAEARVVGLVDGASSTVRVVQLAVGGADQPFVRALVRAARRGVEVRLLLSDAWYVREENRRVAGTLEGLARAEGLPLRVRLASPRGRYGKVHAKAAVVDGERVLLGSLNWNNASARRHREVAVVLHGERTAAYFARVFRADWRGGRWRVPAGLVGVAVVLAGLAATLGARVIEFERDGDEGVGPEPIGDWWGEEPR